MLAVFLVYISFKTDDSIGDWYYLVLSLTRIYYLHHEVVNMVNRSLFRCPHIVQRASIITRLWVLDPYLTLCSGAHLYSEIPISLLIGENCIMAINPRDLILGNEEDPYAVRSILGRGIVGPTSTDFTETDKTICDRTNMRTDHRNLCHFAFRTETHVKPIEITQMYEVDFNEVKSEKKMSVDDHKFLQKVQQSIHKGEMGVTIQK